MESNISKQILAALFAAVFLSAVLLIFIQNIYVFLVSLIIILGIILGMIIGLEHIKDTKMIKASGSRQGSERLERIFKETKQRCAQKSSKQLKTLLCPNCGGKELYYEAGLITGYKYHCKDCDYIGAFVIEKDFNV
jgi:hypothetical protein